MEGCGTEGHGEDAEVESGEVDYGGRVKERPVGKGGVGVEGSSGLGVNVMCVWLARGRFYLS